MSSQLMIEMRDNISSFVNEIHLLIIMRWCTLGDDDRRKDMIRKKQRSRRYLGRAEQIVELL